MIKESTSSLNAFIPSSATLSFRSRFKGLVTTATVKAPTDLATLATIGEAPVPVPPPIPAAIKTMSEPSNKDSILS